MERSPKGNFWASAAASRIGIRAALVIGTLASFFAFHNARTVENGRIDSEFERGVADRVAAVQQHIDGHHHLLVAVAALWNSSDDVTRDEFRVFVEILREYPHDLQAISWVPAVAAEQRESFEEAVRRSGPKDFQITERGDGGEFVPAARRSVHYPVTFIEPLENNRLALGYDAGSEGDRLALLNRARDTGRVHTTRRLRLVQQDEEREAGFLAALPVYRSGAELRTVEDRRRHLLGFATEAFRIGDLVKGGLSTLRPGGIDLYFLDPLGKPGQRLIYQHASRTRSSGKRKPLEADLHALRGPRLETKLSVGDHHWVVIAAAAPGFIAFHRGPLPWVILFGGLGLTALLATYLAATARRTLEISRANEVLSNEVVERQRSEQALRNSEERLRRVIENMPVLMAAFDKDWNIVAWNGECERVTGYLAIEMVGNARAMTLLFPDRGYRERWKRQWRARTEDFRDWEWELVTQDGSPRTILWSDISRAFPVPGWTSWGIGIDVTERKRVEAEREQMHLKMLEAQKLESLGVLVGGIAHDFNNLLTAILGNTSLALEELPETSPACDPIEQAVLASERAALLTEQLLVYAGKAKLEKRRLDLSDNVREISRLAVTAVAHRAPIRLHLAEDLPSVEVDPGQLQQLILNFVTNAAEACEDGDGEVHIETSLVSVRPDEAGDFIGGSAPAPGRYLQLEVRDTGVGMDPEVQARVFDPFYTTKFAGRGLGLAAALGIVRSHRGGLRFWSAPGVGSSFQVLLPAAGGAAQRELLWQPGVATGQGVVLAVDDESMILSLVRDLLEERGYQVLTADSGQRAVQIFRERNQEIACVLLDLVMPGLDGPETYRVLREICPEVFVLFSSGYSEAEMPEGTLEGDRTGFMRKPYTARDLVNKIGEAVTRVQPHGSSPPAG